MLPLQVCFPQIYLWKRIDNGCHLRYNTMSECMVYVLIGFQSTVPYKMQVYIVDSITDHQFTFSVLWCWKSPFQYCDVEKSEFGTNVKCRSILLISYQTINLPFLYCDVEKCEFGTNVFFFRWVISIIYLLEYDGYYCCTLFNSQILIWISKNKCFSIY